MVENEEKLLFRQGCSYSISESRPLPTFKKVLIRYHHQADLIHNGHPNKTTYIQKSGNRPVYVSVRRFMYACTVMHNFLDRRIKVFNDGSSGCV